MRTEEEIKKFLFTEMAEAERESFENEMFASDDLFFEVADVENRLVDAYVAGRLPNVDFTRFEGSLNSVPERLKKIANARLLAEFIEEERVFPAPEPERAGLWQQITGLLSGRSPVLSYAMTAAVLVFAVAAVFLLVQNRQKNDEIASLREQQTRQTELQTQLEDLRRRESELQTAIDAEREATGDFSEELDRERTRREQIERELEKLRSQPPPTQPTDAIIASVLLLPSGAKGGSGDSDVNLNAATKRLSIRLSLPDTVQKEERLSVQLNQKPLIRNVAPRVSGTKKSISVSVSTRDLLKGMNQVDVTDATGRSVSSYEFNVNK